MALGTANLLASLIAGSQLASAEVDDIATLLSRMDDEVLFDLVQLNPPAGASSTHVNVGYIPLCETQRTAIVFGNPIGLEVQVEPIRVLRSSTSGSTPRRMVSATSSAGTVVAMPTTAPTGKWGIELLYAQIAWVDASNPTKGTQVTFQFATSPTYVTFATAPNFATLPANTSTTWNVPLCYVRNLAAATGINATDIFEVPPGVVSGFAGNLRQRIAAKVTGIDARRAYSSANNDPTKLIAGGSSAFATGTGVLKYNIMPMTVGRAEVELVVREILVPKEIAKGNSNTPTFTVVDDTRDWRGANFLSVWNVPGNYSAYSLGEDVDNGSAQRTLPASTDNVGTELSTFIAWGQSWNAHTPGGSSVFGAQLWAAALGASAPLLTVAQTDGGYPAGSGAGLAVDASTGALKFYNNLAGTPSWAPIYVIVFAWFSNHR